MKYCGGDFSHADLACIRGVLSRGSGPPALGDLPARV